MGKVHFFNRTFAVMACEGTRWKFIRVPEFTIRWNKVTCKQCLKKRKRR